MGISVPVYQCVSVSVCQCVSAPFPQALFHESFRVRSHPPLLTHSLPPYHSPLFSLSYIATAIPGCSTNWSMPSFNRNAKPHPVQNMVLGNKPLGLCALENLILLYNPRICSSCAFEGRKTPSPLLRNAQSQRPRS